MHFGTYLWPNCQIPESYRKSGSGNTRVTSDFWRKVEIWPFHACAMKICNLALSYGRIVKIAAQFSDGLVNSAMGQIPYAETCTLLFKPRRPPYFLTKRSLYLSQRWTDRDEILQEHADCYCKACRKWKFAYFKNSKCRTAAILEGKKWRYLRNRSSDRDEILRKYTIYHCKPCRRWKFAYFENPKWRTAAILEIRKSRYLATVQPIVMKFCTDCQILAVNRAWWWNFHISQIQDGGRPPHLKSKIWPIETKFCCNMQVAIVNCAESKNLRMYICTNIAKRLWSVC